MRRGVGAGGPLASIAARDEERGRAFRRAVVGRADGRITPAPRAAPLYAALLESPRDPDPPRDALLARLAGAWPEVVPLDDADTAGALDLVRSRVAEVRVAPLGVATEIPARPRATALARAQAEDGVAVANLRQALLRLGEEERRVVALLDGTHAVVEVAREAGVSEERGREVLAWCVRAALLRST